MTEMILTTSADLSTSANGPARRFLDHWLSNLGSDRTRETYGQGLREWMDFTSSGSVEDGVALLFTLGPMKANALVYDFRRSLVEKDVAPSTVNARLTAIRSLVKHASALGVIGWTLNVPGLKIESYRDTTGPGRRAVRAAVETLQDRGDAKGKRDVAIVRLLHDLALRRGEVIRLDVEDLDLEAGTVAIIGKGRTEKVRYTLPDPTKAALADWMEARGPEPGPLFTNFNRAGRRGRLSPRAVNYIMEKLSKEIGATLRPHGLRHTSITQALDATNGDVRAVQKFSRHRDLRTLTIYDDNRQDFHGQVARLVAV